MKVEENDLYSRMKLAKPEPQPNGNEGGDGSEGSNSSDQNAGAQGSDGNNGGAGPNGGDNNTSNTSTQGGTGGNQHGQPPALPKVEDLTDDQILALLKKRNPNIQSLDDISKVGVTEEDEATKAKKRANEVLTFALQNNLVDKTKYDDYLRDSTKPARVLVYEDFSKRMKARGITDDQKIDVAFRKFYHEDVDLDDIDDPDEKAHQSAIVQEAQENIETQAKRLLKRNYPEVVSLDSKYDQYLSKKQADDVNLKRYQETAALYTSDVDAIIGGLKKKTYSIGDKQTGNAKDYDFDYKVEDLNRIKEEFLSQDVALKFIANYDKSVLQEAIQLRLEKETEEARINHVARSYFSDQMAAQKIGRHHLNLEDPGAGNATRQGDPDLAARVKGYMPQEQ